MFADAKATVTEEGVISMSLLEQYSNIRFHAIDNVFIQDLRAVKGMAVLGGGSEFFWVERMMLSMTG